MKAQVQSARLLHLVDMRLKGAKTSELQNIFR
jgi:hypothetical protein